MNPIRTWFHLRRLNVWKWSERNEQAWMRCMDQQIKQRQLHIALARVINAQAAVINVMHARLNLLEERQPARPVRRTTISREPLTVWVPTKEDC